MHSQLKRAIHEFMKLRTDSDFMFFEKLHMMIIEWPEIGKIRDIKSGLKNYFNIQVIHWADTPNQFVELKDFYVDIEARIKEGH
jgi:hypothetical protein